ncbi:hypothetical protein OIV83_000400 [Microbotryomycetes sp. JL201]|nr:hypothetical protein OIV83_000400 [Microbotryomycetes sp. JL201]
MAFKRALSDDDDGAFSPTSSASPAAVLAAKKVKSSPSSRRLTAAEREQRKEERMERNRRAAQASRDRKKAQQDHLETRIAELEEQLAAAVSGQTTIAVRDDVATSATDDDRLTRLEHENNALRLQLSTERAQSAALKARLGSLEAKFSRLEDLLKGDGGAGAPVSLDTTAAPSPARPILPSPAPSQPFNFEVDLSPPLTTATNLFPSLPTALPDLPAFHALHAEQPTLMPTSTATGPVHESGDFDSSRLVAREVESLPRKLSSHPSQKTWTMPRHVINQHQEQQTRSAAPTLHQVLASIQVPRAALINSPSRTLGTTGLSLSALPKRRSMIPLRIMTTSLGSRAAKRSRQARRPICSRFFNMARQSRASSARRR